MIKITIALIIKIINYVRCVFMNDAILLSYASKLIGKILVMSDQTAFVVNSIFLTYIGKDLSKRYVNLLCMNSDKKEAEILIRDYDLLSTIKNVELYNEISDETVYVRYLN